MTSESDLAGLHSMHKQSQRQHVELRHTYTLPPVSVRKQNMLQVWAPVRLQPSPIVTPVPNSHTPGLLP
jgi:hypothetical protein